MLSERFFEKIKTYSKEKILDTLLSMTRQAAHDGYDEATEEIMFELRKELLSR